MTAPNRDATLLTDEELLSDALDHIQRIAHGGMNPTKRLDWIELRAKVALRGERWTRDMRETPDDSREELRRENTKLRRELAALRARIEAAGKGMPSEPFPHVPAAFINAIAEEGTKDGAIRYLQKQWNETRALAATCEAALVRVSELQAKVVEQEAYIKHLRIVSP